MIFVGDVALAEERGMFFSGIPEGLLKQAWVGNLEGAIVQEPSSKAVYNNLSGLDAMLKKVPFSVFCLANNHITDTGSIDETKAFLKQRNIQFIGAGKNLEEAAAPLDLGDIVLLNFGWPVIQCIPATDSTPGTNPLIIDGVLSSFDKTKLKFSKKKIVVVLHWNYELEFYPMPAHRELGRQLIDRGAELVIGHHSHLVQGVEMYKGKYLVHGLGNWAFSQKAFNDGKLVFPSTSLLEMAFEYSFSTGVGTLHYFQYNIEANAVKYKGKEDVSGPINEKNTPYSYLPADEYDNFFVKNRVKRKILPVFYWQDSSTVTWLKEEFLKIRDTGIKLLIKLKNIR